MNILNIWQTFTGKAGPVLKLLLDVRPEEAVSIVKSSRLGAFLATLNALLIALCLWSEENAIFLFYWLAGSSTLFALIAKRSTQALPRKITRVSKKAINRLVIFTLVSASPWVILTIAFLGTEDPRNTILILLVAIGMSAGGSIMLYRVPLAALQEVSFSRSSVF
ncbi:MAG: hypothetical protein ACRBBN_07685 [Methyloligellaceae bacterium]